MALNRCNVEYQHVILFITIYNHENFRILYSVSTKVQCVQIMSIYDIDNMVRELELLTGETDYHVDIFESSFKQYKNRLFKDQMITILKLDKGKRNIKSDLIIGEL